MESTTKYIANNITVNVANSEIVESNGLEGDAKREIWMERGTEIVWIETNGNPEIYETLTDARAAL